jgi:hypothetical protein
MLLSYGYEICLYLFDSRFAIRRRIRLISVGGQWDDNLSLATSAFDLDTVGHQSSQEAAAFTTD